MSAVQRKDRLYVHLAASLQRLKQHTGQTTDLFEGVQGDLDAMRTFAGLHASNFMTVASELNAVAEQEGEGTPKQTSG